MRASLESGDCRSAPASRRERTIETCGLSRKIAFALLRVKGSSGPAPFLFQGCLKFETTTQVNRDGSLQRTIVMSGDSLDIFGGSNPVTIDSTWTAMLKKTGSDSYHLTATRLFDRVEDMNEAIKGRKGRTPRKGTALHWRTHGSGTRNGIIGTSSSHTTGNS